MALIKKAVGTGLILFGLAFLLSAVTHQKLDSIESISPMGAATDGHETANLVSGQQEIKSETVPPNTEENTTAATEAMATTSEPNLTEILAKQFAQSVLNNNLLGPDTSQGEPTIAMPGELDVNTFVKNNGSLLDWTKLVPELSDASIKIQNDSSKTNLEKYLTSFQDIINKGAEGISFSTNQSADQLAPLRSGTNLGKNYENIIGALYALPVPAALKDFHKKEIAYLTAEQALFERIGHGSTDPLAAILATKMIPEVDKGLAELKTELNNFVSSHQLFI